MRESLFNVALLLREAGDPHVRWAELLCASREAERGGREEGRGRRKEGRGRRKGDRNEDRESL